MKEETGWGQRVYIEVRTGQGEGASLEGALYGISHHTENRR